MSSIFKAYDIRGIYGESLTDDLAYKIGRAYVTFLKCKSVVIGRDMRPHSIPLFKALTKGITEQGSDVVDIGMCSTPMSYFANGSLKAEGSIMITASHNPGEWNGFKLCRESAIPISGITGIKDIEKIVMSEAFAPKAAKPGKISTHSITKEYIKHIQSFADLKRPVHIAIDYANGMGIEEGKVFKGLLKTEAIFDELDGNFPNHEANPLKLETFEALQAKVRKGKYDFGVYFDGDADRAGFCDENGDIVSMDMITGLIAEAMLKRDGRGAIFYDLRSSWSIKEIIEENGGTPMMSRVGHAFIKKQMREADAVFAGELSGHYYFKDNFFTESSSLAVIYVANLVSQSGKTLSELIKPIRRYFASGEINSEVADSNALMEKLKAKYSGGKVILLDGLSIEFDNWWFNVRGSNTEPLVRLNMEARTKALMEEKRDELLAIIRS